MPAVTTSTINEDDYEDDDDDGGFRHRNPQKISNEHSSLSQNKVVTNLLEQGNQLPILNLATMANNSNLSNSHNTDHVTLASTTMSSRIAIGAENNGQFINNEEKKFKTLNEYTTSAHEFLTQSISQNQLNHIDSSNDSTKNMNSPSKDRSRKVNELGVYIA